MKACCHCRRNQGIYRIVYERLTYWNLLTFAACACLPLWINAQSPRLTLSADDGWRFTLGDVAGAETPKFDDHTWRKVNAPHDWSIEAPPAEKNPTGASGGYAAAGVGWYRKAFTPPNAWKGKRVLLEFDGVAANATVYLNGEKLGEHPYAYTSFRFDLTDHLHLSSPNEIAVRSTTRSSSPVAGTWVQASTVTCMSR